MSQNEVDNAWLKSEASCEPVIARDDQVQSKIWFKSKPVDRNFCYRVTQLQLCTDSRDQGYADDRSAGSWTWFELVILPSEAATEPKKSKEGKELSWRSHNNQLGNHNATRHFGVVFDRRSELLANFEVGDVLAVRVCARFSGWVNYADRGFIVARVLNEDLFTPHSWTLTSNVVPKFSEDVEDGSYSFMSTTPCNIKSEDNELKSKIWFTTPPLDQDAINRLESIQLFTRSRLQSNQTTRVLQGDSFSWFDLVILEKPTDTIPKVTNGVSLVWLSHSNDSSYIHPYGTQGQLFDEDDHQQPRAKQIVQIKGSLEPGNVVGVRVCAQFAGWENYAEFGQLVVRIRNTAREAQTVEIPDVTAANDGLREIQKAIHQFYKDITPADQPVYSSATTAALANEARADLILAAGPPPPYPDEEPSRPLRLLSLDGGGVRGVSSLRILKRIMEKVAELEGKAEVKPYEYFDMMVGTSTGGLIALMLGRLRMSIDECEQAYDEISKKVFGKKGVLINTEERAFVAGSYIYEAKPLEDAVRDLVRKKLGDAEANLLENDPPCKVFVMSALASTVEDGNTAVHLRSYDVGPTVPSEYTGWPIWQAARATSAAPIYFDRFKKNGKEFVDGGLGWNNPIYELISELPAVYGKNFGIGCLLSLGTGIPPELKLGTGLSSVPEFIQIATNSEVPHKQLERSASILPRQGEDKYWRFNMSKQMSQQDWVIKVVESWLGLKKEEKKMGYQDIMVKMDDWEAIPMIRELTDKWLQRESQTLLVCARRLSMKK
uniref:PNPLA domain-containing protein n=1 Tax=Moniliophthora roreri TaxID=221103 RepID=A0A0W0FFI5_MONRR